MILLYNWQTLIAGLLALIGAAWTVKQIRTQIEQANDLEENRRLREERAAKAVLPLALSEICQYARDCLHLLARYVPATDAVPDVRADVNVPRIPTNVIETLQACARFADEDIVNQIAGLLSKLQVQYARLEGLIARSVGSIMHAREGIDAMVDAADVYAKASTLFEYGRSIESLRRRAPAAELRTALFASGLHEETHPSLYDAIGRLD